VGIVDTLGHGFAVLNRRLWLILIPVALDLLFWLGPKLSAAAVLLRLADQATSYEQLKAIEQFAVNFNLLFLLALYVPTIKLGVVQGRGGGLGASPGGQPEFVSTGPIISLSSVGSVFALGLALIALGMLVGALYLGLVASLVRDGAVSLHDVVRRLWRYWGRMALLGLTMTAAVFGLMVPPQFIALVSPPLGSLLLLVGSIAAVWLLFYLYFALYALFINDCSMPAAILSSVDVVRHHFWSALLFITVFWVITAGWAIIWQSLATVPLLVALCIVANAYIGTGLTAAAMYFYLERVRRPASTQAAARPGPRAQ
jgi:hypothetical protein